MSTYTIVNIPGWENLSLHPADRSRLEDRLNALAHDIVPASVPRDKATPFREELRKHLTRVVDQARAAGASLVCLPVADLSQGTVPASYSVAEVQDPNPFEAEPEALLRELLSRTEDEARLVEVDHQPALREETVVAADPDADPVAVLSARRVTYTIASPDMPGRFVIFTFTTLGNQDPDDAVARVLVEVFDAHMSTLRWTER